MAKKIWLVSRLEQLNNGKLVDFIVETLKENEKLIIELNKRQLLLGKRADGTSLGDYSPRSLELKQKRGKPSISGNKISLHDTGEFWNKFFVEVNKDIMTILSKDEKTSMLIFHYYEQIFGLSDESILKLQEKIIPTLRTKIMTFLTA